EELVKKLGWDQYGLPRVLINQVETALGKAESARHQQLAYAGWLTFNMDYQKEKHELHARYGTPGEFWPWPLPANVADQEALPEAGKLSRRDVLSKEATSVLEKAGQFMPK